jgi:spectinomycin phosphotransferase
MIPAPSPEQPPPADEEAVAAVDEPAPGAAERRPDETTIRHALRAHHGIDVVAWLAEHDGADAAAWSYRVRGADGRRWFVKLRRAVDPAAVLVPRALREAGLEPVVASVPPKGRPWLEVRGWSVLVAPLIDAPSALRAGLGLDGWHRLGAFAAALHHVTLSEELAALLPVEDFLPQATGLAREVDDRVRARADSADADGDKAWPDAIARDVARRWLAERATILRLADRADALARRLRDRLVAGSLPAFVLCHADLHAGNVLVEADGGLRIVDWDGLLLAPPERDLMFVRGSAIAGIVSDAEADAFEAGYGPVAIDRELIAYYRIDWAVQDLAGFARDVLDPTASSALDRTRAAALFHGQFTAGDEVASALAADAALEPPGPGPASGTRIGDRSAKESQPS